MKKIELADLNENHSFYIKFISTQTHKKLLFFENGLTPTIVV
jgi:hypothetical protein